MNSLAVALDLYRRGFMPVPVKPRDKRPIHDDWQRRRYSEQELPRVFTDGENVGILLGDASDNTVDIDLDHPKAGAAVRTLGMPKTLAYHRSGRAHLLVRCDPLPKTTKFIGYRGGKPVTFCEVRANGCQSVAPGSIHPSGDAYEWLNQAERADWSDGQALNFARDVSTVCLLADHWLAPSRGESGVRHQMALAVAGFLARRTKDEQTVLDIVEAAASVAGDHELLDRRRAVQDTLAKIRRGVAVVGLPTLAEMLGEDDTKTLAKWWPDDYPVLVAPPSASAAGSRAAPDDPFSEAEEETWAWAVYDGADFVQMVFEQLDWLVGGFIKEQAIVFDFGPPGSLKTITGAQLCVSLVRGLPLFGLYPTKRTKVLIIQEDTLEGDFQAYLRNIIGGLGIDSEDLRGWLHIAPPSDLKLDRRERLAALDAWMTEHKPGLVMLDAFYLFHDGDGMTAKELNPILRAVKALRRKHRCAFWILDHDRKTGKEGTTEGNPIDRMYGGRPKSAACDAIVESAPVKGDKALAYLSVHKLRGARPPEPIRLRLEDGLLVIDGTSAESAGGATDAVYEWLIREGGSRTKRQISHGTGLSIRSVEVAIGELEMRGLAREQPKTGREKNWIGLRKKQESGKVGSLVP